MAHTLSQRYFSTRGGFSNLSFEDVVLKGLSDDGGLFVPEQIPKLPNDWSSRWRNLNFEELAFEIFSLYISPSEIPPNDLKDIISRSYRTFRTPDITPLIKLDEKKNLYLLELFHGPTFAFKDVALQFLGNLFEYFLVRKNHGKSGQDRDHLTVIGATSGDTGSAAIYGLRGKKDVSIIMLHPKGKVSPVQEAQMTTILDANVHNVSVEGSFDDCQDIVKAMFADREINKTHKLAAVNSINWARINAQISYFFQAYFTLLRSPEYDPSKAIRVVVPSGNFGDILAGWFAKRMGLPISDLTIATNSNDILHRFMTTGTYSKQPLAGPSATGGLTVDGVKAHSSGVKETLSPAMDILVSSNFERLLAYLAFEVYGPSAHAPTTTTEQKLHIARDKVHAWLQQLKTSGGFTVDEAMLAAARAEFSSERVSDAETTATIRATYLSCFPPVPAREGTTGKSGGYILDPHSAIGIAASLRHEKEEEEEEGSGYTISLATAHPAKFAHAVDLALKGQHGYAFEDVLPEQFRGLEGLERRVQAIAGEDRFEEVRKLIERSVPASGR